MEIFKEIGNLALAVQSANDYGMEGTLQISFPVKDSTIKEPLAVVYIQSPGRMRALSIDMAPLEDIEVFKERTRANIQKAAKEILLTDEELAARAYGVPVRSLTIGQLDDWKKNERETEWRLMK